MGITCNASQPASYSVRNNFDESGILEKYTEIRKHFIRTAFFREQKKHRDFRRSSNMGQVVYLAPFSWFLTSFTNSTETLAREAIFSTTKSDPFNRFSTKAVAASSFASIF